MKRKGQPCLYCRKVPKPPPEKKIVSGECLTVLLSPEDLSTAIADAVERALYYAERNGDSELVYYREQLICEAASEVIDNTRWGIDDEETEKILAVLYPDRNVVEERSGPEADSQKVLKEKPDRYDMEAAADQIIAENYAEYIEQQLVWTLLADASRKRHRASQ